MNINKKEFKEEFKQRIREYCGADYKKNALKEIAEVEATGKTMPHTYFIVSTYPDFNNIEIKLTYPDMLVMKFCMSLDMLKKMSEKQIDKFINKFYKNFLKKKDGHLE